MRKMYLNRVHEIQGLKAALRHANARYEGL